MSAAACKNEAVIVAGILSSLAWQLHEKDPAKVAQCLDVNLDHTDEVQIAELLRLILIQLSSFYIIVEVEDIFGSMKGTK